MTERYEVCPVREFPPGESKIIEINEGAYSIGVFNIDGEFYALANVCPHQLAPLCEGRITGEIVSDGVGEYDLIREGEIIQCPWHGWKFNIKDGTSVFNPHKVRTRTYEASVEKTREADNVACGTPLQGEQPPIENYDVEIEESMVVVYA
jgi:nitrite reductase/ring-hydroxylating ferredoxin subunit